MGNMSPFLARKAAPRVTELGVGMPDGTVVTPTDGADAPGAPPTPAAPGAAEAPPAAAALAFGPPQPSSKKRRWSALGPLLATVVVLLLSGLLVFILAVVTAADGTPALPDDDRPAVPDASWYGVPPLNVSLPDASLPLSFFAHGSCADQRKPQRFWRTLLGLRPELFIFNGDIVYGDCYDNWACSSLPQAWRQLFTNSHFADARATLPMTGMLDDHDYGANDCDASNPNKAFAKEIFLERFGAPPTDVRRTRGGLYTVHTLGPSGQRTQIIMLDTRWARSPFVQTSCYMCAGMERYVPYNSSASARHTILGEEQWAWLGGVLAMPADLRIVVSTVQVLALDHGWERWGLIPTEVNRLVSLIRTSRANGVVLLSGDRHTGGIYTLPRGSAFGGSGGSGGGDGAGVAAPYDLIEVTASSLTHSVRLDTSEVDEGGHYRIGPLTHQNNFGTVAVDWEARTLTLDLRASDDCGLSAQPWGEMCAAHNGSAGANIMNVTVALDALAL